MKPEVVAQARRLYHHVLHGGTLRPEDVAFMVEALEEAEKKREWAGLTDEEFDFLVPYCENKWDLEDYKKFAKDIEAKLKEKNK